MYLCVISAEMRLDILMIFMRRQQRKKSYDFHPVKIYGEWHDLCDSCREQAQYKTGTTVAEDFARFEQ